MNTALGNGTAQGGFIAKAVDVNVTIEGIHVTAEVVARLQALQPKNAVHDRAIRHPFPSQSNRPAAAKDGADGLATADFPGDMMEPKGGLIGVHNLADTMGGRRNPVFFSELIPRQMARSFFEG